MAVPWAGAFGLLVLGISLFRASQRGHVWKRSLWFGASTFYTALVLYRCFLNREPGSYGQLDLRLWSTVESASGYHYFIDNVIMFIPAGALLVLFFYERFQRGWGAVTASVITGVVISLAIECLQAMTGLGVFHVDDLAANGIGDAIGVALAVTFLALSQVRAGG